VPTMPGWTVRCVSDDIAWMSVGEDGRLYAINPETGFFDRVSGSSYRSRATMDTIQANTIFTNVGLTADGDVWWEGMTKETPAELIDWTGQKWTPGCGRPAAHVNARYTTPASQCPVLDPDWENPNGVPISAIIFGGRRTKTYPLVTEAMTWEHGIFLGSLVSADNSLESTSVVRESFAMMPYCPYSMGEYYTKWQDLRQQLGYNAPKMYFVNWFRTDEKGNTVWPGFGENSRVLKWICQRTEVGSGQVVKTPFGYVPSASDLDLKSLDITASSIEKLLKVDAEEWTRELDEIQAFYKRLGNLPEFLTNELKTLEKALKH